MPTREIRHPLIRHKLGLMRRADISTKNFRELAQEVGALLTYEATKDLPLENYEIPGWAGPVQVEKIAGKKITVVPILRAGIGMLSLEHGDNIWAYFPDSDDLRKIASSSRNGSMEGSDFSYEDMSGGAATRTWEATTMTEESSTGTPATG